MMKTVLLIILIMTVAVSSFCQSNTDYFIYTITFDDSYYLDHLRFDSIPGQANIWQIGTPNKTELNSPLSPPNVIITDSLNAYPSNNTSSFSVWNIIDDVSMILFISGYYWVDSDSLNDYGIVEFSKDNGNTWIDVFNRPDYFPDLQPPILSGKSNGWEFFYARMPEDVFYSLGLQIGDTVLFRFTFSSYGSFDNKDGLMFDELLFADWYENLPEYFRSKSLSCFPNPTDNQLNIVLPEFVTNGLSDQPAKGNVCSNQYPSNTFIEINSVFGQNLLRVPVENGQKKVEIDVTSLPKGMVIVHLVMDGQMHSTTKVMIR